MCFNPLFISDILYFKTIGQIYCIKNKERCALDNVPCFYITIHISFLRYNRTHFRLCLFACFAVFFKHYYNSQRCLSDYTDDRNFSSFSQCPSYFSIKAIIPARAADIAANPTVPNIHLTTLSLLVIYGFKSSVPGIVHAFV